MMTPYHHRVNAANGWNRMQIGFLIDKMKEVKSSLELFELLGSMACDMIDEQIEDLEHLIANYR